MSSQRFHSSQITEINAPISVVWEHLVAFDEWNQWNPSVRLPADFVLGQSCKAKLAAPRTRQNSKGGQSENSSQQKRWISTSCTLDEVGNRKEYAVTWTTQRGFFKNTTSMKLTSFAGTRKTTLTHTQSIYGPRFSLNGSPRDLLTNSSCINQCFKNHVECLHFQSLLMDASSRDMSCNTNKSNRTKVRKNNSQSSTSMTCPEDEEEEETVDSGDFWTSSARIRNAVVSQLVEEAVPEDYCVMLQTTS
ncbi:polyketide cyclase / dehydrase and lipid transport domain containing protein [Nitzschia inconspicua]|uniref:Polyketide cyclase / dehydrase and lipid transport domain containing protein n=1 Tax=Nitzschia inconspicua TaxID=303405 RepID=A0A9K3KJZ9_9STRA|nr:polyketide cyclase / dehydrase and lipid transport domain containing protein [Nitzschia inconspicua]